MTVFFTSDQHYGHTNIIRFCARPFADVSAMNEALIARHNAVVGPDDDVWHLGDFVFKGDVAATLVRLNGRHRLVAGNHDRCHPCHRKAAREARRYLAAGFVVTTRTSATSSFVQRRATAGCCTATSTSCGSEGTG
jgi:calcineurin-like phosphoesterase family protein